MKQNKDWTDAMRSALRDAELPPVAGGWERLQRELGGAAPGPVAPEAKPRESVWRIYWPRIAAAAAVVLIGVVAGEFLLRPESVLVNDEAVIALAVEDGGFVAVRPEPAAVETESVQDALARVIALPEERAVENAQLVTARPELLAAAIDVSGEVGTLPAGHTPGEEPGAAAGEDATSAVSAETTQPSKRRVEQMSKQVSEKSAAVSQRTAFADEPFVAYVKPRKTTSFSLFGGGGVAGGNSGALAPRMAYSSITSDVSSVVGNGDKLTVLRSNTYDESSFRHHQPLSVGLAVRKEFAHGFSLESGVNYTLLRSDVRMRYSSDDVDQKLHFIGIPLRLNWQFLERGRFSLYIGAGGMVEKCVSAKFGTKTFDESGVQWSALAAVGAQYRLGSLVGLYFEPEGSYYFTETGLRTARTDSPLTLTLRLGVRLSF